MITVPMSALPPPENLTLSPLSDDPSALYATPAMLPSPTIWCIVTYH